MKPQEVPIEERFDTNTTPNGGIFADRPDATPRKRQADEPDEIPDATYDDGESHSEDDPTADADEFLGRETIPQKDSGATPKIRK